MADRMQAAARRIDLADPAGARRIERAARLWRKGADGEALAARRFDDLRRASYPNVVVVHDRAMPRRRGNIDHLLIGPGGVVVADSKHCVGGVELRDGVLRVRGIDRSGWAAGVHRQVAAVRAALAAEHLGHVAVLGVLHWVDPQMLPRESVVADGVPLLDAEATVRVAVTGVGPAIDATTAAAVARALVRAFPPA